MEDAWTAISLSVHDAYMNMAIDEDLLKLRARNKIPNTVRFYRWMPSAVSIGYFQSMEDEVDVEACRRLGVDFIRRITGGGAVFHDYEGEITYSVVVKEDDPTIPRDVLESYKTIGGGIVEALLRLGLEAEFTGVNDITVKGRKLSGNAQTRREGVILQHGTILLDLDVGKMFQVLRVSGKKLSDKSIKSVEERVTSIRKELGFKPSFEEVEEALKSGFEKRLGVGLNPASLGDEVLSQAERVREKYRSPEWLYMR